MHTLWGSHGQRVLQLGILKETQPESASDDLLVPPSYFIIEFPILISVRTGVSLLFILIDNKASMSCGTLLHVMNRASNSCISSPKFQIDPFLSSLNHLIVVGPRLDGNSLYINPSLLKRYHLYIMTYMLN